MRRALAVVAVLLAGCSGDGSKQASPATTQEQRTTTTLAPGDQFLEVIERRLEYDDPSTPETALGMAQGMCEALDTVYDNSAATDEAKADLAGVGLDQTMAVDLDDRVTAIVFVVATDKLCPQHTQVVADYLRARGLPHA